MFRLNWNLEMNCSEKQSKTTDLLFTWENVNAHYNKSDNFFTKKWFVKQRVKSYGISSNFSEEISNEINLNSYITNVSVETNSVKSNEKMCHDESIKSDSVISALPNKSKNNSILSNSELSFSLIIWYWWIQK